MKRLLTTLAAIGAIATMADLPEYRVGNWAWNDRGNHRAVVRVEEAAPAVQVHIPWRRRDSAPETKAIRIYRAEAATESPVDRFQIMALDRENGDIVFDASAGAGEYYIYFLPYQEPTHWAGDPGTYFPAAAADVAQWRTSWPQELPQAQLVALESKSAFDSMYPMEVPATVAEMAQLRARHAGRDYLVFKEDRSRPIRMRDELPYIWLTQDMDAPFVGTARPGEMYAFQLGVYALKGPLQGVTLEFSPLTGEGEAIGAERFHCLNTDGIDPEGRAFEKNLTVAEGQVQPLWILLDIPAEAQGGYRGTVTVKNADVGETVVPVELTVAGEVLPNRGWDDPLSMARLSWLDSTIGLDHSVPAPFLPLESDGASIRLLDRQITFTPTGMPQSILSRGIELLARPIELSVTANGAKQNFAPTGELAEQAFPDEITRSRSSESADFLQTATAKVEFDGSVTYAVALTARHEVEVDRITLELPFEADRVPYAMGMGQRGGLRPAAGWDWNWQTPGNSMLWLGDVDGGIQLKLERAGERWGDSGELGGAHAPPPDSWFNQGLGRGKIQPEANGEVVVAIDTGKRKLAAGEVLDFRFRLLITPFKRIDPKHWRWRWQSQWGGSGDADYNMALMFHGDANCGNSYINYPFLELDAMKRWIHREQQEKPAIHYPAAGNLDFRQGSAVITFHPEIVPAHHGPGSPAFSIFKVAFPGGDEMQLFWNSTLQGFSGRIRDGYRGVRPNYLPNLDFACATWPQGQKLELTLKWQEGEFSLWHQGTRIATGEYPWTDRSAAEAELVIVQNPEFPVHSVTISDRPEGGTVLFAEEFTQMTPRVSTPKTGSAGQLRGEWIAAACAERPWPQMQPHQVPEQCMPVLYYTVRELSNHAAELWALRSLGDEIFSTTALVTAPDAVSASGGGGGYPWLREHLLDGYAPAWRMPMGSFNDASIGTNGLTRWHNFYLEGMAWLMRETGTRGLYLDGIGYGRGVMRRMRKLMTQIDPESHINIHSGNNYDFQGMRLSAMNAYMEHLPFIDSLWIGELFSYDRDPDYWLVEISGIPFGLTGEMLNNENGGNPYRGMVYGMTSRMHPSASAMWQFWDDFEIEAAEWIGYWQPDCPVVSERGDIRTSVYKQPGRTLVALAHWPEGGLGRTHELVPIEAPQELAAIPALDKFTVVGDQVAAAEDSQTELRAAVDGENLYLAFTCRYPDTLRADVTGRDGEVWTDDSIDFFFLPDADTIIQFIGNANGAIWDVKNGNRDWNGKWQYQTSRSESGAWSGMLSIPLTELFPDGKMPESWGFNAFRTVFADTPRYSSWSAANTYGDTGALGKFFRNGAMPQVRKFVAGDELEVDVAVDYAALGLDPQQVRWYLPGINHFQAERELTVDAPLTIRAGEGALLVIEKQVK